jgi:transposase
MVEMIVIGADTHKRSHALCAVDYGTGRVRGRREIAAEEAGHLGAIRWARRLDGERVWALEDCRHVSRRLEQALLAAGERVIRVAPGRMGSSRRGQREVGKSDQIDAWAIAQAVVRDGIEQFPVAYLDERAMDIRLLSDHRQELVRERTGHQNRLRWRLVELCPELERSLGPGSLSRRPALARIARQLGRLGSTVAVRIAREELERIRVLNRQIQALEAELEQRISVYRPRLLAERGCGTLTSALLIGRTAGTQRFRSDACFGRQTGASPIPCSSGKHTQQRLNRGGDRQLNRALHTIAITRAKHDPTTQAYLAKKQAQGKTRKGALRCLKRHLARHIYHLLNEPPLPPNPAPQHPTDPTTQAPPPHTRPTQPPTHKLANTETHLT